MYYVYILLCSDNSLYTGITPDLQRRMRQHLGLLKGGAKYTALRPPKKIAAVWTAPDRSTALKAEHAIKQLTAAQKRRLTADPERVGEMLAREVPLELTVYDAPGLQSFTKA